MTRTGHYSWRNGPCFYFGHCWKRQFRAGNERDLKTDYRLRSRHEPNLTPSSRSITVASSVGFRNWSSIVSLPERRLNMKKEPPTTVCSPQHFMIAGSRFRFRGEKCRNLLSSMLRRLHACTNCTSPLPRHLSTRGCAHLASYRSRGPSPRHEPRLTDISFNATLDTLRVMRLENPSVCIIIKLFS